MDEAVSDNANEAGSRPSGRGGSKISSRSSEHSIAKLMETLQATAGSAAQPTTSPSLQSLKNQTSVTSVDEQPEVSISMAQSMPASMLTNQLQVSLKKPYFKVLAQSRLDLVEAESGLLLASFLLAEYFLAT